MVIYVCFYIILMLSVFCVLLAFTRITVQVDSLKIGWFLFVFALAIFVFYAEPSVSDDLNRHYYNIQRIRQGSYKISDTVLASEYIVFWIIGKIGICGLLPACTVMVYGYVIWSIVRFYIQDGTHYNCKTLVLYLLSALGGCGIFYIVSGVRFSLAISIWYLLYLKLYKKHRILYYISCIPLLLFHMATGGLLLISIVHEYLLRKKKRFLCYKTLLFMCMFYFFVHFGVLIKILSALKFSYAKYFLEKVLLYINTSSGAVGGVRSLLLFLYYTILFLGATCKYKHDKKENDIAISVAIIAFFSINIIVLFERMSYILGVASFPICSWMCCNEPNKNIARLFQILSALVFSILAIHSFYMMICHLQFGGINFRNELFEIF